MYYLWRGEMPSRVPECHSGDSWSIRGIMLFLQPSSCKCGETAQVPIVPIRRTIPVSEKLFPSARGEQRSLYSSYSTAPLLQHSMMYKECVIMNKEYYLINPLRAQTLYAITGFLKLYSRFIITRFLIFLEPFDLALPARYLPAALILYLIFVLS